MIKNGQVEIHDVEFKKLCAVIEQCKGNVYLVTEYGDKLNLKSKLCQLLGFAQIFNCAEVVEAKLICDNQEDEAMLFQYNLYNKFK